MFPRKAFALAGLVLAIAVVCPAAALANAGGTDRPIALSQSGTTTVFTAPPTTGTLLAETTDIGWHLGKATTTLNATIAFTGPGAFVINGSSVTVAANGDQLFGTLTGAGTQGSPISASVTIDGGTGRFEGASGSLTGTIINVLVSPGVPTVFDTTASFEGTISY